MLQENREGRLAPRQSSSFKLLQEALEAEERGEARGGGGAGGGGGSGGEVGSPGHPWALGGQLIGLVIPKCSPGGRHPGALRP